MAQPSAPIPPPYSNSLATETQQQQSGYVQYPPGQFKDQGVPPQAYVGGGYAPPQPGYPQPGYASIQQPMPQPTIVMVSQPMVSVGAVGPTSMMATCPNCRNTVYTSVSYDMGQAAWIICILLCLFGLWPFCLIPLCCTDCQDATHRCPTCNTFLGHYKRS